MADDIRYSYEEVEERVQAYLRREADAAEQLIEAFQGFLIRWLQVLGGNGSYSSKYHRNFVALYVLHKGKRIRILKGDPRGHSEFIFWGSIVRDRYAGLSREEKWHELVLCLLDLATRYNPYEGIRDFHTYAMRSYPYYLHRRLEQFAGDLSAFSQMIVPLVDEQEFESDHEAATLTTVDDIELGETWIAGATAGDGFAVLTSLERQIILHYYEEGLSDREIAERIGLGRCSVNRRRINAIAKMKTALEVLL